MVRLIRDPPPPARHRLIGSWDDCVDALIPVYERVQRRDVTLRA
jgi:hypothetical protein